ncbi:hypothetical protein HDU97_002912 [Phlyctochytrium planicorne]|nr:hypothetical protein HDU97_002912 [Phlyctochytrium planicorne]
MEDGQRREKKVKSHVILDSMSSLLQEPPQPFPELPFVFKHSADGCDTNVLILLHGLGDSPENFMKFGEKMALPQTALIAVKAPIPIPLFEDMGTGWYPAYDSEGNDVPKTSQIATDCIEKSSKLLQSFMEQRVINKGWPNDRCFVMGFSQGGSVALHFAAIQKADMAVNGIISISGWPLRSLPTFKNRTRFLVTHGNKDKEMALGIAFEKWKELRKSINGPEDTLQVSIVDKKDHAMPKSQGEVEQIMKFFASGLAIRNLKLEAMHDVYEIKTR